MHMQAHTQARRYNPATAPGAAQVIDPPGSQYMMLVMEFLEKGPVLATADQAGFGRMPEEVAADFFRQGVCGLEYLHHHKVVHGDIKPENLLVSSSGELKISDFGCSRCVIGTNLLQMHVCLCGAWVVTRMGRLWQLLGGNSLELLGCAVLCCAGSIIHWSLYIGWGGQEGRCAPSQTCPPPACDEGRTTHAPLAVAHAALQDG